MHFIVIAVLIVIDQLSKIWAVHTLNNGVTMPTHSGESIPLFLGFHFTYTINTGAAFGIFQNNTMILGVLSAVVSLALIIYLATSAKKMTRLNLSAFSLILAGALGNMIDRFYLGFVRDMIDFHVGSFYFPIFNFADSCVVIGACLLLLASFLEKDEAKDEAKDVTPAQVQS